MASLTLSFIQRHPDAAARVLDALDSVPVVAWCQSVPARLAAPVLVRMHPEQAARVVGQLDAVLAAALVRAMPYLDGVTVLRLVSDQERAAIFSELPTRVARDVTRSLVYPQDTVGAWMESSIAVFRTTSRVEDVLRYVRRHPQQALSHVFVIRAGRQLLGAISVANLIRCDAETALSEILDTSVAPLSNRARLSEVAAQSGWDEFNRLPVVGRKGNILGGLSRGDLRRGLREQRRQAGQLEQVRTGSHLCNAWLMTLSALFRALSGQRL